MGCCQTSGTDSTKLDTNSTHLANVIEDKTEEDDLELSDSDTHFELSGETKYESKYYGLESIILSILQKKPMKRNDFDGLIMCYPWFTDSLSLCQHLVKHILQDNVSYRRKRIILRAIDDWIQNYWDADFVNNEQLQQEIRMLSNYNETENQTQNENENDKKKKHSPTVKECINNVISQMDHFIEHKQDTKQYIRCNAITQFNYQSFLENKNKNNENSENSKKTKTTTIDLLNPKDVSYKDFAEQLSIMSFSLFCQIDCREFIYYASAQDKIYKERTENAQNIATYVDYFNKISNMSIMLIISESTGIESAANNLNYLINVATVLLYEWKDVFSAHAIFAGLHSTSIHTLRPVWKKLQQSTKNNEKWERLNNIFSMQSGYSRMRKYLRQNRGMCIPYIGMLLQDLRALYDGNKQEIIEHNGEKFVNMLKFDKMTAMINERIVSSQNNLVAKYKPLTVNNEIIGAVFEQFERFKDIDSDQMYTMARELKNKWEK